MDTPAREDTAKSAPQAVAMDIMPPKVAEAPPIPVSELANIPKSHHSVAKPHVTRSLKRPSQGIGLVVFATIAIVLGLGLLLVYAYLRTNGISIL